MKTIEAPIVKVVKFQTKDVITTSGNTDPSATSDGKGAKVLTTDPHMTLAW